MRIRRKDSEDATTTEELLAHAITEDLAEWLRDWVGQSEPIGLDTKAAIFRTVMDRLDDGVEI